MDRALLPDEDDGATILKGAVDVIALMTHIKFVCFINAYQFISAVDYIQRARRRNEITTDSEG